MGNDTKRLIDLLYFTLTYLLGYMYILSEACQSPRCLILSLPPTPLISVTHQISSEGAEADSASSKKLTSNQTCEIQPKIHDM